MLWYHICLPHTYLIALHCNGSKLIGRNYASDHKMQWFDKFVYSIFIMYSELLGNPIFTAPLRKL